MALNVANDLSLFDAVVPCGLEDVSMTSLWRENGGTGPPPEEVARVLAETIAGGLGVSTTWIDGGAAMSDDEVLRVVM